MDLLKLYTRLCERGKTKRPDIYTERHHIVPESFYTIRKRKGPKGWLPGDSDDPDNITRLTDREHELAHYLLTKIYKDDKRAYLKTLKGYEMRSLVNPNQEEKRHFSSRRLMNIRAERARLQSELMKGEGNPQYGREWTDEEKEEQSRKISGRKQPLHEKENQKAAWERRRKLGIKRKGYSEEYKQERSKKYSGEGNPNFGKTTSDETKKKIGDAIRGTKQSDELVKRRADAVRGSKRELKPCEHCGGEYPVNTYPRFHGDNCVANPDGPRYDPVKAEKLLKRVAKKR